MPPPLDFGISLCKSTISLLILGNITFVDILIEIHKNATIVLLLEKIS